MGGFVIEGEENWVFVLWLFYSRVSEDGDSMSIVDFPMAMKVCSRNGQAFTIAYHRR